MFTGVGRTGETHRIDGGVGHERLTDLGSGSGHEVETPGGNPMASTISASTNSDNGATSDGLSTTVRPAAIAAATLATA